MSKRPSSRASKGPRSISSKRPEAILTEISTGVAILKAGTELAKSAKEALKKVTVLEISVRDSAANEGKHHVKISFWNHSDHGIYIESLTIHRPGEDNKEFSILKGGGIDVIFEPIRGAGISQVRLPSTQALPALEHRADHLFSRESLIQMSPWSSKSFSTF